MAETSAEKNWGDDLNHQIIELYNDKKSFHYIAKVLGCHRTTISDRCKSLISAGAIEARDKSFVFTEQMDKIIRSGYQNRNEIKVIAMQAEISVHLVRKRINQKRDEWGLISRSEHGGGNYKLAAKKYPPHQVPDVGVIPKNLLLEDLNSNSCRYPVNSPDKGKEFLFCGHDTEPDKNYCPAHDRLCNRQAEAVVKKKSKPFRGVRFLQ